MALDRSTADLPRARDGETAGSAGAARLSRVVPAAAAALLGAAAAGTVAVTLAAVYRLHVPLPYWDEWYSIIHFRKFAAGGYGLADLAAQHNEHRLLFPRLFFFADELLFGLSGLLDATATVLLQAANAVLLIALSWRLVARPAHRALLAGFVLVMLFTLRQEQNFTNGFQLQFVGVFTAAALAGTAYVAALERRGRGRALFFALAALGCFVATYTMANGVLAGFVLAGLAMLYRAPWRVPLATAVLSAGLAAVFFHAYVPGNDSMPLGYALTHPLPYLRFVAVYVGNPIDDIPAAQGLGTLGLLLAAGAAWRVATARARDGASLALLAVAGFVLASAAATAYGRIGLGIEQAVENRYATPSGLFWCALVAFWFPVAVGRSRPAVAAAALGAAMTVLSAAALDAEATAWPALAERSAGLRRVSDSLISGLYDADAAATYDTSTPDMVASFVPFLREHHLAAFADPDAAALGRPVATLGRLAPAGACGGTASARADAALGPGGVMLSGTARDDGAGRAPHRIVLADATGTVVGFGSASLPGQPSRLWTGYARAGAGDVLHAYARLADGALCGFADATAGAAPGGG